MTDPKDNEEQVARWEAEARKAFPFVLIKVPGAEALAEWERRKAAGTETPLVVGDEEALRMLLMTFGYPQQADLAEILRRAEELVHPQSLVALRDEEKARLDERVASDARFAASMASIDEALKGPGISPEEYFKRLGVGTPPYTPSDASHAPREPNVPSIALNCQTDAPLEEVYLIILPTQDWTTAPAYLRYGNWNDNPPAEYHVAALRSWRDRYGAELVGMKHDALDIRVARKPVTQTEALELAEELYVYCSDLVDQGTGSVPALAAELLAANWWTIWWD